MISLLTYLIQHIYRVQKLCFIKAFSWFFKRFVWPAVVGIGCDKLGTINMVNDTKMYSVRR